MKRYQEILFDLDGTLTDPGIGITNSVKHALAKYGIEETDITRLYRFIGPPLSDSFKEYYAFSTEQAMQAIEYYREYYADRGIFEVQVYEGIVPMLQRLQADGRRLLVATSKPEPFARQVLAHFGLTPYFEVIAGGGMDETRIRKAEVIRYALDEASITDLSHAVMVGDRKFDICGAAEVGMPAVGVLFGYGSREELTAAGAAALAEDVQALETILCSGKR